MSDQSNVQVRPYHHGDLRRAIIDHAMAMLEEGGASQLTLREVARRAGVSHGAPYKHFPDRAALLAEIALIGFEWLGDDLAKAERAASPDLVDALAAVARAYLSFGLAHPAIYRLMFTPDSGGHEELQLNPRAFSTFEMVLLLLEKAQAAGIVRKRDLREQAAACWAQMHGLTMLTLDGLLIPQKVGDNPAEAAIEILLEGLRA